MAEPLRIRERPLQAGVVALLEAEGLPVSDLTEAHLEHFFFAGTDSTPTGIVGLEVYGHDALLSSLAIGAAERTRGLG